MPSLYNLDRKFHYGRSRIPAAALVSGNIPALIKTFSSGYDNIRYAHGRYPLLCDGGGDSFADTVKQGDLYLYKNRRSVAGTSQHIYNGPGELIACGYVFKRAGGSSTGRYILEIDDDVVADETTNTNVEQGVLWGQGRLNPGLIYMDLTGFFDKRVIEFSKSIELTHTTTGSSSESTVGPNHLSTCSSEATAGPIWTGTCPTTSSDSNFARVTFHADFGSDISNNLYLRGYGFNLPVGATITSVTVTWRSRVSNTGAGLSVRGRFVDNNGNSFGPDFFIHLPSSTSFQTYPPNEYIDDLTGGGASLNSTITNNANFGLRVRVERTNHQSGSTCDIQRAQMTIKYTLDYDSSLLCVYRRLI